MLHSYAFSNFRSFRDRVEVSLKLAENASVNGWDRMPPFGQRLTTAMAVLGANASGKTSLIQPLAFLAWFIPHSFNAKPDERVPITPHVTAPEEPTEFEIIGETADEPETLWRYRLGITIRKVISESLERRTRRGQWHVVFDRTLASNDKYNVTQHGFDLDQSQAESVRPNVSLISWAAQFGVPLAQRLASMRVLTNINYGGKVLLPREHVIDYCTQFYAQNEELQARMRSLIARLDLGLSDILFREHEVLDARGEKTKHWFAFGKHLDPKGQTEYLLPFSEESSGTKTAFMLLTQILSALETGGLVVWDELESDLHPHMLEPLLDLFSNSDTNRFNAQIIFTCHAVEVLRILQKSQVMLVEKEGLESSAWRLDTLEGVRSDENRVSKYLAGAYGAVPRI
jgi:AAA domain, putative AbiEii toxin, Type IV TA system